ncbi:hypothetical protein Trydic_g14302 [Trypoxylus dichotomus]
MRNGGSFSVLLFNLIMGKIIDGGRREILFYADDATLFSDSEDGPSAVVNIEVQRLNIEISTLKTQSMVIARQPRRCKLELNNRIIGQEFT